MCAIVSCSCGGDAASSATATALRSTDEPITHLRHGPFALDATVAQAVYFGGRSAIVLRLPR